MLPEKDRRRAPPQPDLEQQVRRTKEWIAACEDIENVRKEVGQKFRDLSIPQIDYLIATLVVQNNLGTEWYTAHVESDDRRSRINVFLRSGPKTPTERRDHYLRVMELARRIFELQQEDFIELLIENLRRRDLEGALFEADVVRMLVSFPVVIELRPASGVKGDDYDIDLWLFKDTPLAIEAKTRAEAGAYSDVTGQVVAGIQGCPSASMTRVSK